MSKPCATCFKYAAEAIFDIDDFCSTCYGELAKIEVVCKCKCCGKWLKIDNIEYLKRMAADGDIMCNECKIEMVKLAQAARIKADKEKAKELEKQREIAEKYAVKRESIQEQVKKYTAYLDKGYSSESYEDEDEKTKAIRKYAAKHAPVVYDYLKEFNKPDK